jgi:hypothetical protein
MRDFLQSITYIIDAVIDCEKGSFENNPKYFSGKDTTLRSRDLQERYNAQRPTTKRLQKTMLTRTLLRGPQWSSPFVFCTTWVPLVLLLLCNGMHGHGPLVHPLAVLLYDQVTIKKKKKTCKTLSPNRSA